MCPEDRQDQKNVFFPFFQPATSEGRIQGGLATHTQTVNQEWICLQGPLGGDCISSRKLERFAGKEAMTTFQGCIDCDQALQCKAGLIEVTGLEFIGRKHSLGVLFCPSASLHYWHF